MLGQLKVTLIVLASAASLIYGGPIYVQTNLASDVSGMAPNLDPNLKNPWGMSFGANTPFWVSNQASNNSTLYNNSGVPQALIVSMPAGSAPIGPTGQVFSGIPAFAVGPNQPAIFIFANLNGTITGWNPAANTANPTHANMASVLFRDPGAVLTGLANGDNGTEDLLYAADRKNGKIDVFNSSGLTTLSGSFTDPNLPAGFTPYNVQNIGGKLYVEYSDASKTGQANNGIVDVFDLNGVFQSRITSTHLDAPWGVTLAPANFGPFSNDLLVGNFGDGTISAFTPAGTFLGTLSDAKGDPIVNSGLWALDFRTGPSFNQSALFFTAGINGQKDGLFAEITAAAPEPGTWSLIAMGLLAGVICLRRSALRMC